MKKIIFILFLPVFAFSQFDGYRDAAVTASGDTTTNSHIVTLAQDSTGWTADSDITSTTLRVGIGVANPTRELEVDGEIHLNASGVWLSIGSFGGAGGNIFFRRRTTHGFQADDDDHIEVMADKGMHITQGGLDAAELDSLDTLGPTLSVLNEGEAGYQLLTFGDKAISPYNADSVGIAIKANGNAGIGTTNPITQFHVEASVDTLVYFKWEAGVDAFVGRGETDTDITYVGLRNADGEQCYIYPNADQNGIVVSGTKP